MLASMIGRNGLAIAAFVLCGVQAGLAQQSSTGAAEYKGTLVAASEAEITPRFDGIVARINFAPGQVVKKGDLLFEFMALEKDMLLDAERARVQRAEAELRQAEAAFRDAQSKRIKKEATDLDVLNADVAKDIAAANLREARAKVRVSELVLKESKLFAPLTGVVGRPAIKEGAHVKSAAQDKSALVEIAQIDPIRVVAHVPAQAHFERREILKPDDPAKQGFELALILPGGARYPHAGRVVGGGQSFDAARQTIEIVAEFPNPESLLRPGLNVTLQSKPKTN